MNATSARSLAPSARQAAVAAERSGPRVGVGHSSATARNAAPAAIPQPARRSGIDEAGPGSVTGRMKASSSDVEAPASTELTTPAKITPKPTSAVAMAASHVVCETSVPRQTSALAASASVACACRRWRSGPPKSTSSSIANEPKAANVASDRIGDQLVADREHRRHHDSRTPGATQRSEIAIALAEPLQWVHRCSLPGFSAARA